MMDCSKNSHPSYNIRARELYSIINNVTDVPPEQVQDVFQAFAMIVEYCLSKGIDLKIPYIGTFKTNVKYGRKKGNVYRSVPKGANYWQLTDDGSKKLMVAEEAIYKTVEKDEADFLMPTFKYLPSFKEKIKEATKNG